MKALTIFFVGLFFLAGTLSVFANEWLNQHGKKFQKEISDGDIFSMSSGKTYQNFNFSMDLSVKDITGDGLKKICLRVAKDKDNSWELALVDAPNVHKTPRSHFAEFNLVDNGKSAAQYSNKGNKQRQNIQLEKPWKLGGKYTLRITNFDRCLSALLLDESGETIFLSDWDLDSPLPVSIPEITCQGMSGEISNIVYKEKTTLFHIVVPKRPDHFEKHPYSVHAHIFRLQNFKDNPELYGKQLKDAGFKRIRCDIDWKDCLDKNGNWDWSRLDSTLDYLDKYGIKMHAILCGIEPQELSPPWKHPTESTRFMEAIARHTQGRIETFEVGNEPNVSLSWGGKPDAIKYTAYLKLAYQAIKRGNPNAKVVSGGIAFIRFPYIEEMLKAGAGNYFDIFAFHPYVLDGAPEINIQQMNRLWELLK